MHTSQILANALRETGLEEMAKRAEEKFYHDFESPIAFPEMQLLEDLKEEMARRKAAGVDAWSVFDLINRHLKGEFDASEEESDEWAESEDGRAAFTEISRK